MTEFKTATSRTSTVFAGPALATLLVFQIILGWEWLSSGITKAGSGNFVSGLAANLKGNVSMAPHWYRDFLTGTVIPHARTFGILILLGEIIVGLAFILAAVVWLVRWSRLSDALGQSLLVVTMLSAVGATFMAINFHLANGANHPWLMPKDGFNETIDVDAVLAMTQLAFFGFSAYLLVKIRREHRARAVNNLAMALVEPLSLPLIVPIDDPATSVESGGETHPAVPQVADGWLLVPLENAGSGPAINLHATVAIASHVPADRLAAEIGVIAAGHRAALRFAVDGDLGDFELQLTYQDHRARSHRLTARWDVERRAYELGWEAALHAAGSATPDADWRAENPVGAA